MAKTRRGTCDGCGRVRKLTYPEKDGIQYYGLCSECFPKVETQKDIIALRRERPERKKYRKAYCCIGGPLNGEFAATVDFYSDGIYAHMGNDYFEFNSAGHARASMIFVHKDLIQQPISAARR